MVRLATWCFTISDKVMFGRIEYLDCVYKVEPIGEGSLHRITKLDPTKVMPLENDALIPPQKLEQEGIVPQGSSQKPFSAALVMGRLLIYGFYILMEWHQPTLVPK